jgi:hypothetical protein
VITSYEYSGFDDDKWHFARAQFGRINLLVGASGTGKTRFLNVLFNISATVVKGSPFRAGKWHMTVVTGGYEYDWSYCGTAVPEDGKRVTEEHVTRGSVKAEPGSGTEVLVERTPDSFTFMGNKLPKLQREIPSVTLLSEEEPLSPLHETFAKVQRRRFQGDGLTDAMALQFVPAELDLQLGKTKNLADLWQQQQALSAKMYLLERHFPDLYDCAVRSFRSVFPTVTDAQVQEAERGPMFRGSGGSLPMFSVREKGVTKWIGLPELSSGMQKVLLIITDILTLPVGSVYIIDEYENSLGVNAIDFLPGFLLDHGGDSQYFITTHHPYLINSMPVRNWRIFSRQGSAVRIKSGSDLEERFGKSKQKAFIQLINDPYYADGAL